MTKWLSLDGGEGSYALPRPTDFIVTSGVATVTLGLTIDANDGSPTVVLVPIPREWLDAIIAALQEARAVAESK